MAAAKKAKSKPKPKPKKAPARKPALAKKKAAPPKKKAAARKTSARPVAPKKPSAVRISAVAGAAPRPASRPKTIPPSAPPRGPLPGEDPVGIVTHYYSHLSVAVVRLDAGSLQVGDTIRILGHTTDFRQRVDSLQVDHESVGEVGRRQEFGLKVKEHAREHDVVYKVAP